MKFVDIKSFKDVENEFSELFSQLFAIQNTIKEKLTIHADGKTLKGNELVGWLGEILRKVSVQWLSGR